MVGSAYITVKQFIEIQRTGEYELQGKKVKVLKMEYNPLTDKAEFEYIEKPELKLIR